MIHCSSIIIKNKEIAERKLNTAFKYKLKKNKKMLG